MPLSSVLRLLRLSGLARAFESPERVYEGTDVILQGTSRIEASGHEFHSISFPEIQIDEG